MVRQIGKVVAAMLLATAPAVASLPARADAQSADAAVPRLSVEKYALSNGLEVILHQDRSVPLVSVNLWYRVGSADEQTGRTGFAHLFEHLMFMGSENVPPGRFDEWLEAAGASPNGGTTQDRTMYFESGASGALALMLWLEADRMGRLLPTMTQQKLDLQREVVKNERRQTYENVPYGRAYETLLRALFPAGHPYSWPVIGSMTDLAAASLEDVTRFFRTYYAPSNAALVIAGDFDADSARTLVARYFGPIPRGATLPMRMAPTVLPLPRDTALVLEDRVRLPRVYWAWPSAPAMHRDDAALDVLAFVLAGDKSSRLHRRLVYELQAAQSVAAWQNSGRISGNFTIDVIPRAGRSTSEAASAMEDELARIVASGVTEDELTRARNAFLMRTINELASVAGKANQLNLYNYFAGTPDYAHHDAARYQRVTRADVQRVARDYLASPRVLLTVVPEGKRDLMVKVAGAR